MKNLIHLYRRNPATQKILLTMRLTLLLLVISVLSAFSSSYAQKTKLDINVQNSSVKDVLDAIETQSEFFFMYNNKQVDVDRKVDLDAKSSTVDAVLQKLFAGTEVNFKVVNRQILLFPNDIINLLEQQERKVSGKVTDASGKSLPGATVIVKGTATGVITDGNGNFTLSIPADAMTLVFSFVGMKTQEVSVGNKTTINLVMSEEAIGLEEIVAIGYGTMKKIDLTGSVSSVTSGKITQRAITSIEQGLQGRMAGVQVIQPSGAPGTSAIVRVRGTNSIQYGNEPLWVVDGFPVSNGISFINPNDIETMTVLKDASATAIYGSRGANGVVMVTTKKGTAGKTKINYEFYYGAQQLTKKIDLMNVKDWATQHRVFWQRFRSGALLSRAFPQDQIDKMDKGTDWQDEVFRTGAIQSHNLSITGGNDKTTFAISGNYINQEGIVINSEYSKGTVSINLDHKANNKFKLGANIITSYEYNQSINDRGVVYGALIAAPTSPVRNPDGTYYSQLDYYNKTGIMANISLQNPVQTAYEQAGNFNTTRMLSNYFGSYEFIQGLIAKVSLGADIRFDRSNAYTPSYFYSQSTSKGAASINSRQSFGWVNENTLTYSKTYNKVHSFSALAGFTLQREMAESVGAGNTNFFSDVTQYYNLGNGALPTTPSSDYSRWSMASFLGRINYSYADKYLATVSARYDGSSRFGTNNRFGFFPSAALAWRVSQEKFLKDVSWLSDLKLRTSYGKTGNQEIPLYQNIQSYYKTSSYVFGSAPATAVVPGSLVNPDIKWETTDQYNAGIDLAFFQNKLSFTVDYYNKRTNDLLFGVSVPRQGGFTTVLQNIGSVENKGFEFGVNVNIVKKDLHWTASGNISFNRNKVISLANADRFFGPGWTAGGRNGGSSTIIMVGQPLGVFWGNIFDGLWQTQEEFAAGHMSTNGNVGVGFENYRDIDGNGIFEEGKDETIIGDPHPDFEFGITNSFNYKGFDLSFFINVVYGNDVFNANKIEMTSQVNINNQLATYKPWDGPGTSNTFFKNDRPGLRSGTFPNRVSTQYIEDGSFIRLQNLTFGYTVPFKFMKNSRIYIAADNLFTLTHYSGYNPQVSSMGNTDTALGIDFGTYPAARTLRLGIQANF
jgi:TonB-linked SusC/RagA family outer membrane protein